MLESADAPSYPLRETDGGAADAADAPTFFGRVARSISRQLSRLYRRARQADPFANTRLWIRIVAVNLFIFVVFASIALGLSQSRSNLVEQKVEALMTQAALISAVIAENAGFPQTQSYNWVLANDILRSLSLPTGLRAQIYDSKGRLTGDTRTLHGGEFLVETAPLEKDGPLGGLFYRIQEFYDRYLFATGEKLELYRESIGDVIPDQDEIYVALGGDRTVKLRENSERELIISVYMPVQRVKTVLGVLVLSTRGGDIDAIVARDRNAMLAVLAIALGANLFVSLWVAGLIARPIRRLAEGADSHERAGKERGALRKADIPDYSNRSDEIGILSRSLHRMTNSLYERIGAIESFAADVSHELKNPLTSMRSAVESIRNARSDAQAAQLLEVIRHDADRMDRLITDIANASRLDAELGREQRETIDLRKMLSTIIEISRPMAEDAQVTLVLDLPAPPISLTVRGLQDRLAQVFYNLIDNAVSFSEPGSTVSVTARPIDTELGPTLQLQVLDEGPGIPEDNLESIFRRFYSSRPGAETFGKHSGLGLSICRQIVQAHGGRIWAENRTDRSGARFTVWAPR